VEPILLIDDDAGLREAMHGALSAEGWPVVDVGDGWEGVDWLVLNRPSMVVLDWTLPDFDGGTVAETLHHTYGDSVPLLLVTGTDQGVAERARSIRAFGYLQKPFEIEALYEMVRSALPANGAQDTTQAGD
jgi:DNA-binding response OmpR family regulator